MPHQEPLWCLAYTITFVVLCCAAVQTASMDRGGGGLMATGNIEVVLTGSTADSNSATSGPGGALHCLQCNSLTLHNCNMHSNEASGPGGGACCERCEHVSVKSFEAESNAASAGAGLFLSLSPAAGSGGGKEALGVFDSRFHDNVARGGARLAAVAGEGTEGDGAAGAEPVAAADVAQEEDVSGAGGAVLVKSPVAFSISGSSFTSNKAASGHGGM